MSNYTTEVRYICASLAGYKAPDNVDDITDVLKKSYQQIFSDRIIIYPTERREELLCKILEHYYTREIGYETFGLWKQKLNTEMLEIMPYYNELYKTADKIKDPFQDVDYKRVIKNEHSDKRKRTDEESREDESSSNNIQNFEETNWNMFSATPQGGIEGIDSGRYLTNATKVDDKTQSINNARANGKGKSEGVSDEDSNGNFKTVEKVKGKMGSKSYASMIKEYRSTILNIDMMLINELSGLFINLW